MNQTLKLLFLAAFIASVFATDKSSTDHPIKETPEEHAAHPPGKPHTGAKIEQVLMPPKPPKDSKSNKAKDLKTADTFGLGYYGIPIAYGAASVYPTYYPYQPYYRRHYGYGYGYRPFYSFRAYGALPFYGYPFLG